MQEKERATAAVEKRKAHAHAKMQLAARAGDVGTRGLEPAVPTRFGGGSWVRTVPTGARGG